MSDYEIIEPLVTDQAWVWSGKSVRRTLQLRPADLSLTYALMEGLGARESAFLRFIFQSGLEARVTASGLKCIGGLITP